MHQAHGACVQHEAYKDRSLHITPYDRKVVFLCSCVCAEKPTARCVISGDRTRRVS
ncbi:hypothetical protein GBAR_LOCUS31064 [Geodia barretti]|uniref:Uncharacterized protein n=1 Tax=Geodia barretti TaxID=519541 RepID=A0AA35XFL9_GEOBA|nr:hypothetical protein GBAR_LOCUS31064 [Geodia barretti]